MIMVINSSYPLWQLLSFCESSIGDKRPNAVNMDPINWENKPHTFLYCMYKEKRFDGPKAGYLVKIHNNQIVAGMGWYPSDLDSNIYALCRAYTKPGYLQGLSVKNAVMTNEMQFAIEDTAIGQGYKGGCISVESYNKKKLDNMIAVNNPKRYPEYRKIENNGIVIKEYREPGIRMRQMFYAGKYYIRGAEQHLCYHLFDTEYKKEFTEKIKCHLVKD